MKMTFATNMRCESCVSKVASALDNAVSVAAWEADLASPDKLVRVEPNGDVPEGEVAALIASVGFSARSIEEADASPPREAEPTEFQLSTYKPLLLVVAYVLGATSVAELAHGGVQWPRAMSYSMGFFFLGFAFFKLLDVSKFADAFSTYDVVAKRSR